MTSSPSVTTLFAQHIDTSRRPLTLAISAVVHVAVIALVSLGIIYAPRLQPRVSEHYVVRELDFHPFEAPPQRAARGIKSPAPRPPAKQSAAAPRAAMRQAVQAQAGPQTLLQPDLAQRLAQAEAIPVPKILIWTPRRVVVKTIVAPTPKPTAADARPSLDAPNTEVNLSDIDMASSQIASQKLQILPSTTTPVAVHGTNMEQAPPATTSQAAAEPTPTAILSLSDLSMKDGTAYLPPMNETVMTSAPGTEAQGSTTENGAGGQGKGTGNGAGPEGRPGGGAMGLTQGGDTGAIEGDPTASTHITLPRNGQYNAVIIGDVLEDQYPEAGGVWSGRMAYTVYLHVGLARSWIMQYALPHSVDAAASGNVDHLDAPWPYSIVRPNLTPGAINADALMLHGYVNQSGRLEALSVVFPKDFPQAQFVLAAMQQWQFRPALLGGKAARVEVLLVIPEELN